MPVNKDEFAVPKESEYVRCAGRSLEKDHLPHSGLSCRESEVLVRGSHGNEWR